MTSSRPGAKPALLGDSSIAFSLVLLRIGFAFAFHDVDEIAHAQVHVVQAQPPILLYLSGDHNIARNVVDPRIGRIAVYRDCDIGADIIAGAFGTEHPWVADKRRLDRLA